MKANACMLALAALVLRVGIPEDGVLAATLPKDPCALVKPAEIQAINANAKAGSGKVTPDPTGFVVGCSYEWGTRTREWGMSSLQISVTDTSKVFPNGLSAADIRQRVQVMAQMGGPGSAEIAGIGDGALFSTDPKAHNASASAFLVKAKGVLLEVVFHGDANDALAKKDALVGLLKLAASRL